MKLRKKSLTASDNIAVISLIWRKIADAVMLYYEEYINFINVQDIAKSKFLTLGKEDMLIFFEKLLLDSPPKDLELDLILNFILEDDGFSLVTSDKYKKMSFEDQLSIVYEMAPKLFNQVFFTKIPQPTDDEDLLDIEMAGEMSEETKLSVWYGKKMIRFNKLAEKLQE